MKYLVPHLPEWFEALEHLNLQQALHTRTLIRAAGTPECCSTCGDAPAEDFRIADERFGESIGASFRLCGDCQNIQRMNGARLQPLFTVGQMAERMSLQGRACLVTFRDGRTLRCDSIGRVSVTLIGDSSGDFEAMTPEGKVEISFDDVASIRPL